jgi:3-phenylpropionate/trans-cinnamate dioxygenase ferredoxin reductase component
MTDSVVIVGASIAGVGAANELRRCGFKGRIALVDAQQHLPYDRPPLSKAVLLGKDTTSSVTFHGRDHYARANIDLHLGCPVRALDVEARAVVLGSGHRLSGDAIIIATGARARPFPVDRCTGAVHVLRDLADAERLRACLVPGRRLAIIGGGFIGAEVASSAAALGLNVTVIEAAKLPFGHILGTAVATRVAQLHAEAGVKMLCGSAVDCVEVADRRQCLMLASGQSAEADIVVAGLGSLPNVEWLASSGLRIANGVLCDDAGRTGAPGIFAAGDVAAWRDPFTGTHERHEHWTAAREQARIVAQAIAGGAMTSWHEFVPYFWSDLHGVRLQMQGSARDADDIRIVHDEAGKKSFVAEYMRKGHLVGIVGCNSGARVTRYARRLIRGSAHSNVAE